MAATAVQTPSQEIGQVLRKFGVYGSSEVNERYGDFSPTIILRLDKIHPVSAVGCLPRLALLLFSYLNAACFGQTVTIRLVNVTNQTPLSNRRIYLSGISAKAAIKEEDERIKVMGKSPNADLSLITDTNGEIAFNLPKPAPTYFYVRALLSGSHWDCTCLVRIATEEMLQNGVMVKSPYAERKPTVSIQPKPREVLFALRPVPWQFRLLWPLLKQ